MMGQPEVKTVFVVGETGLADKRIWSLNGIFETEKAALALCAKHGNESFFVGPVPLGVNLGPGLNEWPGIVFPNSETNPMEGDDGSN
ncbi:MAG: hypothetical protein JRC86_04810 [Deltaproteobacteria bacterium]|nr:hypothetical protein [Deltaproteobacteria bacterium]